MPDPNTIPAEFVILWSCLPAAEAAKAARADLETRWRRGEPVPVEQYLDELPHVAASPDQAMILVSGEIMLRIERGETANQLEYQCRFPNYSSALRSQFERLDAMAGRSVSTPDPTSIESWRLTGPYLAAAVDNARVRDDVAEIAGYRIEEVLGQGGTCIVYRAEHLASGRYVALKVLRRPSLPDSSVRFLVEADILRRLKHPNIVTILNAGWSGPHLFIAMELVTGGNLAQQLDGKPHNPRRAVEVMMGIASGVGEAHRHGIIHRDLKPSNVLMSLAEPSDSTELRGIPKVADFGVARLNDCGGTLTATGEVIGTPSYMSPEQFQGRKRDITFATDVYALGAILYQMLTGRPPFRSRKILDLFREIVSDTAPRPSLIVPDINPKLEALCLQCLHKDPTQRIPSAEALVGELARQ
jgi:eukaryotic-like serine/threonine-protein kinase